MRLAIFRNQLFKVSELFIENQASGVKCEKIFVGRKTFSERSKGYHCITLEQSSFLENLKFVLFRRVSLLSDKLITWQPNLIHAHFGVDSVYALKLANNLNVPLITTFHGYDITTKKRTLFKAPKPALINYFLHKKQLSKTADLFICVSDFIKNKAIESGFPKEKLITHYIGIEIPEKNYYVNDTNKINILHVARLTKKKGTIYLLQAIRLLNNKNIVLNIIGDGPLNESLKKYVADNNLEDNVCFLGSQPHKVVMEYMLKADIFCLPSVTASSGDSEGLGMVFLEAAVSSIPVVATKHGGIPEAVENGITGFLVPEKNSQALADKFKLLIESPELRKSMGQAARLMVEEKFDIKKQSKKLEEIYSRVINAYHNSK